MAEGELQKLRERVRELEEANQLFEKLQREEEKKKVVQPDERAVARKEMALQTMVAPWSGEPSDIPVEEFLRGVELVAESGNWEDRDKALVTRMRLKGQAAAFLASRDDLIETGVTYARLKEALVDRFQDQTTPQQYLLQLSGISQGAAEGVRAFADRCRALGQRSLEKDLPEGERLGARNQVTRLVLTAFMAGLRGEAGRSLRVNPPQTLEEAVARASLVEREEGSKRRVDVFRLVGPQSGSEEADVFDGLGAREARVAVRGRGGTLGPCYRCRRPGHIAKDCPGPRDGGRPGTFQHPERRTCFRCGQRGHLSFDCDGPLANKGEAYRDQRPPRLAAPNGKGLRDPSTERP